MFIHFSFYMICTTFGFLNYISIYYWIIIILYLLICYNLFIYLYVLFIYSKDDTGIVILSATHIRNMSFETGQSNSWRIPFLSADGREDVLVRRIISMMFSYYSVILFCLRRPVAQKYTKYAEIKNYKIYKIYQIWIMENVYITK